MKPDVFCAELLNFMARKKLNGSVHFGHRLAALRKSKGLTQVELAKLLGVSQRVITYYENEATRPPTQLLPKVAQVLERSIDELLGSAAVEVAAPPPKNKRFLKRLEVLENLPVQDQKMVLRLIDTLAAKTS